MNMTNQRTQPIAETAGQRRLKYGLNVTVLIVSLLVILPVVNWIASENAIRLDLTGNRAYSLSEQTTRLIETLETPIEITMLFAENDPALGVETRQAITASRREVDDVLQEFQAKTNHISVSQLDPTNGRHLSRLDALVARLRVIYADEMAVYDRTIATGRDQLVSGGEFAVTESELLNTFLSTLDPQHPAFGQLRQIGTAIAGIPNQLNLLMENLEAETKSRPELGRYFADREGAQAMIGTPLQRTSGTFEQIAGLYVNASNEGVLTDAQVEWFSAGVERFRQMSTVLSNAYADLLELESLHLTQIDYAIRSRNCVVLTSDTNAVVLEFNKLFPPPSARDLDSQTGLDQRFAGETVITAGIRQLTLTKQPVVIFCHAEPQQSVIRGPLSQVHVGTVAEQLRDLGFEIREWNVTRDPERPILDEMAGQPVWVIMPSMPRSMQPNPGATQLATVAATLVNEGENVLMSFVPSMIPGFGQADFWNDVTKPLGVTGDTGRVILEQIPLPGQDDAYTARFAPDEFNTDHLLGAAVAGQPTFVEMPVPLVVEKSDNVRVTTILEIKPEARRFATDQWMSGRNISPPETPDTDPYPLVMAVERGLKTKSQRVLVVGCGTWFHTQVVGQRDPRTQLAVNTGNSELFAAGVCWLAHLDELIARSPRAQAIERIDGLTLSKRALWGWFLIGGLPALSLMAGIAVWTWRRG